MKTTRAKKAGPPHEHHHGECCSDDACLPMLRDAAIAEREAILFYLEAAAMLCGDLRRLFLDTAGDEMEHFVMTMRHIAALDSVQAEALEEVGLDDLLMQRGMTPKWATGWQPECACPAAGEAEMVMEPQTGPEGGMTPVCLLTKALTSELEAINKYQKYMEKAPDSACCHHFCHLMNAEKEHVASFIAALFDLTGEPPPEASMNM
jgi:rubrerythrin